MINFKEDLKKDLNVFFNIKEFAQEHEIDGKTVIIVVNDDVLKGFNTTSQYNDYTEGVFLASKTIYVKKEDFNKKPIKGQRLRLDNKYYYVELVKELGEIYEITLVANES